jgi:hypothetical protein
LWPENGLGRQEADVRWEVAYEYREICGA